MNKYIVTFRDTWFSTAYVRYQRTVKATNASAATRIARKKINLDALKLISVRNA